MRSSKGFTLIELLVVIAIIGLLASVVLASLSSARIKGRDARRLADIKEYQNALELYYSDHTAYPAAASASAPSAAFTDLTSGNYLSSLPDDPLGGSHHYGYITDSSGTKYCLATVLEGTPPAGAISACGNALTLSGYNYVVFP